MLDREDRAERATNALDALRQLVETTEDLGGMMGHQLAALMDVVFTEAKLSMPFTAVARAANYNLPEELDP